MVCFHFVSGFVVCQINTVTSVHHKFLNSEIEFYKHVRLVLDCNCGMSLLLVFVVVVVLDLLRISDMLLIGITMFSGVTQA